jgi:hypothetical protein
MDLKLGDTQKLLIEDFIVYFLLFILIVVWDLFKNFLRSVGLDSSPLLHPYHLGIFQISGIIFCGMQLIRRVMWWKYYS